MKNSQKSETTKQLDAFYSTNKIKMDDDITQAQYDLLGEEEWEWEKVINALSLMKLLQFSEKSIREGNVYDNDQVFSELRKKIKIP